MNIIRTSRYSVPFQLIILLGLSIGIDGCAVLFPPTVHSARVETLPTVDGSMESLWQEAHPIRVEAVGNTLEEHVTPVEIRSLHNGREIAFLFRWEDDTKSDSYRKYLGNGEGRAPTLVGGPDDQFAIKFNLSGSALSCMLAGKDYVDDVWHWKAARTNPTGYAQDRLFIVRRIEDSEDASGGMYIARNGSPVQILWKEDGGDPLVTEIDPPIEGGVAGPAFEAKTPSGSQADIIAKGEWKEGIWVLELRRSLVTGHADDVSIQVGMTSKFAIAIFDESEGQVHDNTRWLKLKLD